jgi:adenine-specific DNA methylase
MASLFDDVVEGFESKSNNKDIIEKISGLPSNYVGSKRRLLHYIINTLEDEKIQFDSVFDAFSGSAMVSLLFKSLGKKVYSNDLLTSSAITAVTLLELENIPLTIEEVDFLCKNRPKEQGTFVLDNYKDKFFTEKECLFLDRYRTNVETLCGEKFYCGMELLNKATLASIPNSNFSVYGKDLKSLRDTHNVDKSFWTEKWRDTTRKRRDVNNEIMFGNSIVEMYQKYKSAFSLFAIESHVNQHCFLGGRYYNGQTVANLEHRLKHDKNNGKTIDDIKFGHLGVEKYLTKGKECVVFNSDIIDLLESKTINADLIYLDPPYGKASSDYAVLYRFLEEYLYEKPLEELEHIQKGAKRFSKSKGYQEQFEHLLSLCNPFKTWMLSYNESSYASIDVITSTIKNAGKTNIKVIEVPITYQYRKGKGVVDMGKEFVDKGGKKHLQRGTEYLIIAN